MFSRVRTHVHVRARLPLLRDTAPSPAPFSHSAVSRLAVLLELHRIVIAPSRSRSSAAAPAPVHSRQRMQLGKHTSPTPGARICLGLRLPSCQCVCGCGCVYVCACVCVTETKDLNASREPDTERCSKESQDGVTARPLVRAPRVHRIVLIDPSIPRWGSSTARGAIAGEVQTNKKRGISTRAEENAPLMLEAPAFVVQGSRARLRNPGPQIQYHVIEVEEIKLCRKQDGAPPRVGGGEVQGVSTERSGHQRLHAKRRRTHHPRISSNRLYPSIPQAAARRPLRFAARQDGLSARVDIMQMDERTHCRMSMRRIPFRRMILLHSGT
ncbi:hypothetical protein DFH09DRAFT_1203943 [Mycena vulgaris]|nr:hypothetical protein DFH09DRAFT_1203943 [Mycena vulgaris]